MTVDDPASVPSPTPLPPDRKFALILFAVRAVRVSASTIAVVALLRQEWVAAGAFALSPAAGSRRGSMSDLCLSQPQEPSNAVHSSRSWLASRRCRRWLIMLAR